MDDTYTPVVRAKPERGREIKSAKMQTERLIESLKNVSGQPDPSSEPQEEIYHEGYVDGQKYLVPDSNLEAMKDIINIKMRPRRSLRYKHQTSFEISDYNHFQDKLKGLLDKMDQLGAVSSESIKEPSDVSSGSVETAESRETGTDSKEDAESKQSEAGSKESKASKDSSVATLKSHTSKSIQEEIIDPNLPEKLEDYKEKETKLESNIGESQEDDIASLKNKVQSEILETLSTKVPQKNTGAMSSESSKEPSDASSVSAETAKSRGTGTDSKEDAESKRSEAGSKESKASKESSVATLKSHPSKYIQEEITDPNLTEKIEDYKEKESKLESNIGESQEDDIASLKNKVQSKISETLSKKVPKKNKGSSVFFDQMEPLPIKPQAYEPIEPNEHHIRFLISGHLRDDKPIFIIQEYNSKSNIFKKQKADLIESKRKGNIDLAISGKFYKHNILEELNGEPIFYDILPNKIIINKEKTRVYVSKFSDVFNCEKVVLTVKGEFLRHEVSNLLTPVLSFSVEPKIPEFSTLKKTYNPYNNDTPTMVLIYSPKYVNPFTPHYDNNTTYNNRVPDAALSCESNNNSNLCSCAENNIDSMGPISLDTRDSTYLYTSMLKSNMTEDNLQSINHSSSVDLVDDIEPNYRELYSKKQCDKKREHFPRCYESLNAREITLETPKLRSYYNADEKGEYYSTYADDILEYAKHEDLKQLDSSNNSFTTHKKQKQNSIVKDYTIKEHEKSSDKDISKKVHMKSDENLMIYPLLEVDEGSDSL